MKKFLAIVLAIATVMSLSVTAFAADVTTDSGATYTLASGTMEALPEGMEDVEVVEDEYGIMPTAISGSASYFNNQGTIYVYSPGYSLCGHVKITTEYSNTSLFIAAYDPNGDLINPKLTSGTDFVAIGAGETTINMTNAPSGTYKLLFVAEDGAPVKVTFSLHDWYG